MGEPGSAPCPDIFLLDLNLPRVDGPTILREFRRHSSCAHTPVIIVTSSQRQNELAQINALGITQYFHKPSDLADFLKLGSVVKNIVESARK
jgi:CheY-like chemotaxis protein